MSLEALRAAIPLLQHRTYLFSGGLCPLAAPVAAALRGWVDRWRTDPLAHRDDYTSAAGRLRAAFAVLVGVGADDVALTDNTSRANNLAVRMLADGRPGVVLVDRTTYPSAAYPWLLHDGVVVREVEVDPGRPAVDAFAAAAGPDTLALSVSHVSPLTGERHDLAALAEVASDVGASLVVDAAQSLGVVPVDMARDGVDVVTTTAMKWLLGPPGIGFLAVRPGRAAGRLADVGYVAAGLGDDYPLTSLPDYPDGARHAEVGLPALPLVPAALAGLELLEEVGAARIDARVSALTGRIIEEMAARGLTVLTPTDPSRRAGVVAVLHDRAVDVAAQLRADAVDVWGYGSGRLRIDPHGFNDDRDVDRLLDRFDAVRR